MRITVWNPSKGQECLDSAATLLHLYPLSTTGQSNVIQMEYVQGTDLRIFVPLEAMGAVCSVHKDAVIDTVLDHSFLRHPCALRQPPRHAASECDPEVSRTRDWDATLHYG